MSNPAADAAPNRAIQLAAPVKVYSLAGPIPIRVRYVNQSTAPIQFKEPARVWEVQLGIHQQDNGQVQGTDLPFGKITRVPIEGGVRRVLEPANIIHLPPGGKYDFEADAGKRWPERFFVGRQTLQVKDLNDTPPLLSNPIEIQVAYTAETFPHLLDILRSPDASEETKAWATNWIKRVYPKLETIDGAAAWWTQNHNSPQVRATLDQINHAAGIR